MASENVILTPEGRQKLEEELNYLETEKRAEIGDRIKVAREFGDISENSEYDDAKNEQGMVEARIADLELLFQNVAQRLLDVVAALNALFVYDLTQLLHGVRRDRRAEVCHDQALLQLVVEILVDGLPDDAVVPRLFDPCKNTHRLTP